MAAIVFPRPPPTYNTLSPAQRAQLLRSNAKLGQILGSMPHVLDDTPDGAPPAALPAPAHCADAPAGVARAPPQLRARSLDSARPGPSHAASAHAPARASTDGASGARAAPGHSEKAWRARFPARKPPMLRVGKIPALAPVPGSPAAAADNATHTVAVDGPGGSPRDPTFAIPSAAALRRRKMRKLAKTLGEGVPVHLVFPPTAESDDEEVLVGSPASASAASLSSASASSCATPVDEEEGYGWEAKEELWGRQTAARSKFAGAPERAALLAGGRYVVHYRDAGGVHGRGEETFGGFNCRTFAPIPEE